MGTQGIGVSTPQAAEVAEATEGLARERHKPKVGMLTKGLLSKMLATGIPLIMVFRGVTTRGAGVIPMLHCIIAPIHTVFASPDIVVQFIVCSTEDHSLHIGPSTFSGASCGVD